MYTVIAASSVDFWATLDHSPDVSVTARPDPALGVVALTLDHKPVPLEVEWGRDSGSQATEYCQVRPPTLPHCPFTEGPSLPKPSLSSTHAETDVRLTLVGAGSRSGGGVHQARDGLARAEEDREVSECNEGRSSGFERG